MKVLVAVEMLGTLNALQKPLGLLVGGGATVRYAAVAAAADELSASEILYFPRAAKPDEVIRETKPDLVIIGAAVGIPGSGVFEVGYGIVAMDAGVPVVCYRESAGLSVWVASQLAAHARSAELLHFFVFESATVRAIERRGYSCREAAVIGSAYYDGDVGFDWESARIRGRTALELAETDYLVTIVLPARAERVCEVLVPAIGGLARAGDPKVLFAPLFHRKDPDAPYARGIDGKGWVPRPSRIYDPILGEAEVRGIRLLREPQFRIAVPEERDQLAATDFAVMNPLSMVSWRAVHAQVPFVVSGLPLTGAEAEREDINLSDLDYVRAGVDMVGTATELAIYLEEFLKLPSRVSHTRSVESGFAPVRVAPLVARKFAQICRPVA